MAESISIVLDFLRQHNFERAEEALRIELQGRDAFASFAHPSLTREKLIHGNEKHLPYTDGFPAHDNSYGFVDKSAAWKLQCNPEPSAFQRGGSLGMRQDDLNALEWKIESRSYEDRVLESKTGDTLRIPPSESVLYRANDDKQGVDAKSWKEWVANHDGMWQMNGMHNGNAMDKTNDAQCNGRDFLSKFENLTLDSQFDPTMLHSKNSMLHQQTWNKPDFQIFLKTSPTWTQHEYKDDFIQQDLGAPQLKTCTTVHEAKDFTEKAACNVMSAPFIKVENFASSEYGPFMQNSWLDFGVLGDDTVIPSPITQPFFLDGFEQQEEKQVVHDCIDYLKGLGQDSQISRIDFLEDMRLPWEDGLQNGFGGESDHERHTEDFFCIPPAEFSSNGDICFTKDDDEGFGFDRITDGQNCTSADAVFEPSFNLGSFLDIPVGQDIAITGDKHESGIGRFSAGRRIMQDTPELLSGFATLGDEPTDPDVGYSRDQWDSDSYEDDEDPGYHRQPIEDEAWFLAHETIYPSDDESRARMDHEKLANGIQVHTNHKDSGLPQEVEYPSSFSGKLLSIKGHEGGEAILDSNVLSISNLREQSNLNDALNLHHIGSMSYDGQLMDAEELKLMETAPVWQGFSSHTDDHVHLEEVQSCQSILEEYSKVSLRCINVADLRSKRKHNKSAEGGNRDTEFLQDTRAHLVSELTSVNENHLGSSKNKVSTHRTEADVICSAKDGDTALPSNGFGGEDTGAFSFTSPSSSCDQDASKPGSGNLKWLTGDIMLSQDKQTSNADLITSDEKPTFWKQESNETFPMPTSKKESFLNGASLTKPEISNPFAVNNGSGNTSNEGGMLSPHGNDVVDDSTLDDGEISAIPDELPFLKAEEDEFEVFNLRIIHRKNRTGFEEEKHFQVVLNSVLAGRYLITEYLGSAAFSKAVQARDLQTGMDVCMKIIKNNKDFFDQSLDEIKLLKLINKHDPADKHHVLRLYDYFYHREHLFIVCELLRANLYEFHKFNRESGGEAYFTMPRLQSITRQCLEALEFLHGLGLIHCDLKPENILIKSYSRCEVKVIDLGSSCFQTDHLCSYVQSRSYRAPEVILGLPYDQKIDIWSLGCILAELCSGNVLFQNDSLATLLARVVGIIGPIIPDMVLKGREAHKYFTKNLLLYERNQDTNKLEYLVPKRSSLRHRLPCGDQGFVDFVGYLLQVHPENRPSASEALKHPWLTYPYEPI